MDAHVEKAEPSEESVENVVNMAENLAVETKASDESVENVVNLLENLAVATVRPLANMKQCLSSNVNSAMLPINVWEC